MVRLRKPGRLVGAMLLGIALLIAGPVGAVTLLQTAVDGPSPAQGHAEVIAHGVAGMPAAEVAWRVVADSAEPLDTAEPIERALGFVLADEGTIVVNDLTAGSQTRVAGGEAAFVPDGAVQQRASLNDSAVPYDRLALVAAEDANDGGDDVLVFGGDGFAAPDGNRDIDLLRDVLAADEQTTIDDSGYPVLVLATAGEIEIETADGGTTTLGAGEAANVQGSLTISGAGDGTSAFVAAVIGPAVPAPPRFTGQVFLSVYTCPSDVTAQILIEAPDDVPFQSCEAVDDPVGSGLELALTDPDGNEIPLSDAAAASEGTSLVWSGLTFGDYEIGDPTALPSGIGDFVLTDPLTNVLDDGAFTLDQASPDISFRLYLVTSAEGRITIRIHNCPPGMAADTLAGDFCDPVTEGVDVTVELFVQEGPGPSWSLADADFNDPAWTLSGIALPPDGGSHAFGVRETLPTGYVDYVVVGNGEFLSPVEGGGDPQLFGFELSTDSPSIELDIYNFTAAGGGVGSIEITGYVCPTAESTDEACIDNGSIAVDGVAIFTPEGSDALVAANADLNGTTYSWPIVPLGDFFLSADGLAPAGYSILRVAGAVPTDEGWAFSLSADNPSATIAVFLLEEGADEPIDSDADGLSDADEATHGTAVDDADSDDDCHSDGAEVAADTNPTDATSLPDGACDVA